MLDVLLSERDMGFHVEDGEKRQPRLTELYAVPQSDDFSIAKSGQNSSADSILSRHKRFKIYYRDRENKIPDCWEVDRLTWGITKFTRQLSHREQRSIMRKAFRKWQTLVNEFRPRFRFVEETGDLTPGVNIRFERGRHARGGMTGSDPDFDGHLPNRWNKLAHAWAPHIDGPEDASGDMHFDDDEDWGSDQGRLLLLSVAIHEVGHVLGLKHSEKQNAVMFAFYTFAKDFTQDDINGIEALYGNRRSGNKPGSGNNPKPTTLLPKLTTLLPKPTTLLPKPTTFLPKPTTLLPKPRIFTEPSPNLCHNKRLQVFQEPTSRVLYVTMGDRIHQVDSRGQISRVTALTQEYPDAPDDADLAFSLPADRSVYFLKNNTIWEYRGRKLTQKRHNRQQQPACPQYYIADSQEFDTADPRRPPTIDLYGADQCWSYQPRTGQRSKATPMSRCQGNQHFPSGVKFAVTWVDGKTYAVSGESYVVLNSDRSLHQAETAGRPDWLDRFCSSSPRSSLSQVLILLLFSSTLKIIMS